MLHDSQRDIVRTEVVRGGWCLMDVSFARSWKERRETRCRCVDDALADASADLNQFQSSPRGLALSPPSLTYLPYACAISAVALV